MANLMRVAPELPVDNMTEALQHYETKFGFRTMMKMPEGDYAIVERDGVALHLFENHSRELSPGSIHIFASGLDDLLAELETRGAQITQTIVRQPWGNRDFRAVDSSGNAIKFTEPVGSKSS